jgi:hypothetical protein
VPSSRPLELRLAAVLAVVLGVFGLMGGLLIALGGLLFGVRFAGLLEGAGDLVVFVGTAYALAGAVMLAAGWGLWTGDAWGRILAPAGAAVGAVMALARSGPEDPVGPLVTAALHAVVLLLVVVPAIRHPRRDGATRIEDGAVDPTADPVRTRNDPGPGSGPQPA